MSLVLAVASRAHELFEKYGSIRAELGKACGEKFYPTLLVTARPVLGRRELLLRPGRRQRVTSKLGYLLSQPHDSHNEVGRRVARGTRRWAVVRKKEDRNSLRGACAVCCW